MKTRAKRWLVAWPYLVLYVAVGLAAALLVQILGALPAALITTIVGLALFSPLMGSVVAMLKEVARYRKRCDHVSGDGFRDNLLRRWLSILGTGCRVGSIWSEAPD